MLRTITFTGADNSIRPQDLYDVSGTEEFIEWAILLSEKKIGTPRYPDAKWQNDMYDAYDEVTAFAIHLCGSYTHNLIYGTGSEWQFLPKIISIAPRIQLNFYHDGEKIINEGALLSNFQNLGFREFIFPYSINNLSLVNKLMANGVHCSILFDGSGGRGLLPNQWPLVVEGISCGWAGGLGPNNLKEQLEVIAPQSLGNRGWVDMESSLRGTKNNIYYGDSLVTNTGVPNERDIFDLNKVSTCVEIFKDFLRK